MRYCMAGAAYAVVCRLCVCMCLLSGALIQVPLIDRQPFQPHTHVVRKYVVWVGMEHQHYQFLSKG